MPDLELDTEVDDGVYCPVGKEGGHNEHVNSV